MKRFQSSASFSFAFFTRFIHKVMKMVGGVVKSCVLLREFIKKSYGQAVYRFYVGFSPMHKLFKD